ncbi:MAG: hypothetical protein DMG41_34605 [Acidobacteria bacterium]|nr:MAG: hypothetical protein DMG42_36485 [Acidobacteriota bacterium]PYT81649.1 MAG: hypothetical protein DMG41_34605 [Acidobacteriota bacterium]
MSHFLSRQITISVFFVLGLLVCGARTQATDISDTISTTLTIFEDSKLVGDVTCDVAGAPCIKFGAPGITLRLNGFTLKGRASPPNNCTGFPTPFVPEDGITTAGQSNVAILGPGLVRNFARMGILLSLGSSQVRVERVTAADNCFSGILLSGATNSDITHNVSVRNFGFAGTACGGT